MTSFTAKAQASQGGCCHGHARSWGGYDQILLAILQGLALTILAGPSEDNNVVPVAALKQTEGKFRVFQW